MFNLRLGTQRVKWLAHVGIAQWDEENYQGWKRLGIPKGKSIYAIS
jgi:hypothetical protein